MARDTTPDPESMTLRLPIHIRAGLAQVARRYGVTASAVARMAIAEYLEARGALDPAPRAAGTGAGADAGTEGE